MIAVIDYGMGNLRSVEKAIQVVGGRTLVTSRPRDIEKCDKIVFPGVGAFGSAMKELKSLKLVEPIKEAITAGKPFLGLCLGLQLLFERSEEAPGVKGLCVLDGDVKRFCFSRRLGLKVPHMGWNNIVHSEECIVDRKRMLAGVPSGSFMYFVHSYYVQPKDKRDIFTTTDYGMNFVSGVARGNVYGFQFHPEKSQGMGLKILRNFVKIC